jgi:ferritin-like metal-binding protein YciE
MAELSARDGKLVQYLNEAYGKEKELETALQAHIGMTSRAPYKKRLQQHLSETKRHATELERRIKRLGGAAEGAPIEGLGPISAGAGAAVELGSRALAAAQGPLHAIRGTSEQEKMLKNAKTEFAQEHEEIATYTAIETLAEAVRDPETARLARAIRREEQRMASFLEKLIPTLTKAVATAEVPASERRNGGRSSRSGGRSRSGSAGGRRRGSAASAGARTRASSRRGTSRQGGAGTRTGSGASPPGASPPGASPRSGASAGGSRSTAASRRNGG